MSADTLSTGLAFLREPLAWVFGLACTAAGIWIGTVLVEPARETLRVIRRIAGALVVHAQVHANPGVPSKELIDAASREYRSLAAELGATAFAVPRWARRPLAFVRALPTDDAVRQASSNLIALSNMLGGGPHCDPLANSETADTIRALLRIEAVH